MKCCPSCFTDQLLSDQVNDLASNQEWNDGDSCDFCGSIAGPFYELVPECELADRFSDLCSVFAPESVTPEDFRIGGSGRLGQVFRCTWDIFKFSNPETVERFLGSMFSGEDWYNSLLSQQVVTSPEKGTASPSTFSIFGDSSWEDFSEAIKHRSRFFSPFQHEEAFEDLLNAARATWPVSKALFRARVWENDSKMPNAADMGEPPADKASDGRMCSKGISCLYVADSQETAAAEVRAGMYDRVAIAKLVPKHDFEFVDLRTLSHISPFGYEKVNCSNLISNRRNLKNIADELARPQRATDSALDYVPLQYVAEVIRNLGNDAIGYKSVMNRDGFNLACFTRRVSLFDIAEIEVRTVSELRYVLAAH